MSIKDNEHLSRTLYQNWTSLFLAIIWHIWKARNDNVFEDVAFSTHKVIHQASIYAVNMQVARESITPFLLDPVNNRWMKPPQGMSN